MTTATLSQLALELAALVTGPLSEAASISGHPAGRGDELTCRQRHTGASPIPGGAATVVAVDIARRAAQHRATLRAQVAGPLRHRTSTDLTARALIDLAELAAMSGPTTTTTTIRIVDDLARLTDRAHRAIDSGARQPAAQPTEAAITLLLAAAAQTPRTVTATEAATELGLRPGTVRQWAARRRITAAGTRAGAPTYPFEDIRQVAALAA